jgi:hypothetical protein
MEEKPFGLIKGIKCQLKRTDKETIDRLSQKTQISPEKLTEMLFYNMFTVAQFSKLTGLSVIDIHNKMRAGIKNGEYNTELDFCHPFSDTENDGPKFIIRNEKSEKYLQ